MVALANVLAHGARTPCKSEVLTRSRKRLGVQAPRGFKSLPLRSPHAGFRVIAVAQVETNGLGNRSAQSTEVQRGPRRSMGFRAHWRRTGARHHGFRVRRSLPVQARKASPIGHLPATEASVGLARTQSCHRPPPMWRLVRDAGLTHPLVATLIGARAADARRARSWSGRRACGTHA